MNTLSPRNKWVTVILHTAFWVLLFSLPFLLRPSSAPEKVNNRNDFEIAQYIINDLLWVAYFYFNAYFLIPRLLNKKKPGLFYPGHVWYVWLFHSKWLAKP